MVERHVANVNVEGSSPFHRAIDTRIAGILFEKRAVDQHCIDKKYPPSPIVEDEEEWKNTFATIF